MFSGAPGGREVRRHGDGASRAGAAARAERRRPPSAGPHGRSPRTLVGRPPAMESAPPPPDGGAASPEESPPPPAPPRMPQLAFKYEGGGKFSIALVEMRLDGDFLALCPAGNYYINFFVVLNLLSVTDLFICNRGFLE